MIDTFVNFDTGYVNGKPTILNIFIHYIYHISGISPHYEKCEVTQGTATISIVKDGCMATTLGAKAVANESEVTNAVIMEFKTFLVEGEVTTTQLVTCDVKLCSGTANCAKDLSCKKSDDPYGYE